MEVSKHKVTKIRGNYYIDLAIERKIRISAAVQGKGLSEVMTEAFELYLKTLEKQAPRTEVSI